MKRNCLVSFVLVLFGVFLAVGAVSAVEAPRMTKEVLKSMVGDPNVVVIDVRTDHDWADSRSKIKGAVREDAKLAGQWMSKYPKDKTIVFY